MKLAELHRDDDPSPFVEEIMESMLHGEIVRLSPDLRERLISHFKTTLGRDFSSEQAVDWALTDYLRSVSQTDKVGIGVKLTEKGKGIERKAS